MRLTGRGRDYLLGTLLLEAAGLATGTNLFAALGLALAFTSLISVALLELRSSRSLAVSALDNRIRLFKQQEGRIALALRGGREWWMSPEVESVTVRGPVDTSVSTDGEDFLVRVKPLKAGRFRKFVVEVGLNDAIGLFYLGRQLVLDQMVMDSLPISLLARPGTERPLPVIVGESPAGSPGKGQEFYGIETYTEQSESRDILWKRAASSPHRPLLARVREANNPGSVSIVVSYGEISEVGMADCIDLQCEALGLLGGTLLANGVEVAIVGPDGVSRIARTEGELADTIMETSGAGKAGRQEIPTGGLGILVAVGDIPGDALTYLGRRPVVFVGNRRRHPADRYSMDFTGVEDLSRIVSLVLAG